nr:cell wall hydrolase [uncultured Eisenbergiella sp.]
MQYKKYGLILLVSNLLVITAWMCARGVQINKIVSQEAFRASFMEDIAEYQETSFCSVVPAAASDQRVLECGVLEKKPVYQLSDTDYNALLKIVEAEAGGEDENGKLLVANVVLNRVKSGIFPDTVTEVVYQREFGVCQFSPVSDGRINRVKVSEETKRAVERAVYGEDISQGALYFVARKAVASDKMQWFDNHLTWLFAYGGHEFFG